MLSVVYQLSSNQQRQSGRTLKTSERGVAAGSSNRNEFYVLDFTEFRNCCWDVPKQLRLSLPPLEVIERAKSTSGRVVVKTWLLIKR